MNITGFQVRLHGSGYELTVQANVPGKTDFGLRLGEAMGEIAAKVGNVTTEADEQTDEPAAEEKPKGRGRGRPAKADEAKKDAEEKPKGRGRGRPAKADKAAEEVSDEDLNKATSQAAQAIGAPAVLDVLAKFKVERVGALDQKQRAEFIEALDKARKAAADDPLKV